MIINDIQRLLADAEVGEDVVEDVVGGDFASDFAEVVKDAANIRTDKIRRSVIAEGSEGYIEALLGAIKR